MLIAEAICWRIARCGIEKPDNSIIISRRPRHSRELLAWMVAIEPSWPVDIACSMSKTSAPRTSPTIIRSGRIRSVLRTSSRAVTSPLPSRLGGRVSSRTTCGCCSDSSAESSIVTMRSSSGTKLDRQLSIVVLPEPVPPQTSRLSRAVTTACEQRHHLRRDAPLGHQVVDRIALLAEAPDRQRRAVDRQRRNDRVDARAVAQPRVHHRRRFVHPPPDLRNDPVDDQHQMLIVVKVNVRSRAACRASRRRPGRVR